MSRRGITGEVRPVRILSGALAVHQLTLENQELRARLELPASNVPPLHPVR